MERMNKMNRSEVANTNRRAVKPSARFRIFSLGLMFLFAFQPCIPTLLSAQTLTAEDHYQEALKKYKSNDYQGAVEESQLAIAGDYKNWQAYQLAGFALYRTGNKEASLSYCDKSLQLHPNNPILQEFVKKIPLQADPLPRFEIVPVSTNPKKIFIKDNRFVLGVAFGSPGVYNLVGGYYWEDFGVKGSVGPTGGQLEFSVRAWETKNKIFMGNFSLIAGHQEGHMRSKYTNWNILSNGPIDYIDGPEFSYNFDYIGMGLDMNVAGFYVQAGPAIAQGTGYQEFLGTSPREYNGTGILIFQMGYVYQFN